MALPALTGPRCTAISNGQVAAVVSDVPNDKIRPERRHLAAQQAVLKGLLAEADAMLPMAFGIIADGPKAIQKILSRNQEAFLKQLRQRGRDGGNGTAGLPGCPQYL